MMDRLEQPGVTVSAESGSALVLWTFSIALFTSALLLFSVQPLFAKMALPKLGGAPAVWAVSLCFFQSMLLAGYCYANAIIRWFDIRTTVAIHAGLLAVTLVALPIGLPSALGEPPAGDAYMWLLGVLAIGVGLPFFAVSANAPLLQAWFARTGHPAARDPYFLYAASNAGSLLALFAYPIVIEPLTGLRMQTGLWSQGFGILAALLAASAGLMWTRAQPLSTAMNTQGGTVASARPTQQDRAAWVLLALIPSALMVAVTTYITTDLASAPLFWVIPLALFLATFIVVFRNDELIPIDLVSRALPLLFVAMLGLPSPALRLGLALASFVAAALVCHRQLYLLRPAAEHLTEFYLWMSLGGALGGILSALIAPQLFASAFEFTALMIAALFCRPDIVKALSDDRHWLQIVGLGCVAVAALIVHLLIREVFGEWAGRGTMAVILASWIFLLWRNRSHPALQAGVMAGVGLFAWMLPTSQPAIHTARSFFGVVRVIDTADGQIRYMQHGTTLHGSRRLLAKDGSKVDRPIPATYYHAAGPLSRGVTLARQTTTGSANGAIRMAVIGLGTGSLACTTLPGDTLTYFEIDPVVADIAKDAQYFDFLARCKPEAPIVMGDARLTLGKTPAGQVDYLVVDAFSSDAVPMHLLTMEALEMYMSKLAPNGIVALHVSNRYLDLASSVIATVKTLPQAAASLVEFPGVPDDPDAQGSIVVFVSRNKQALSPTAQWPGARDPKSTTAAAWTDDYSDVLSAIVRQITK